MKLNAIENKLIRWENSWATTVYTLDTNEYRDPKLKEAIYKHQRYLEEKNKGQSDSLWETLL